MKGQHDNMMIDLRNLTYEELEMQIVNLGYPKFRAKQIFQFVSKGVVNIDDMHNLPKTLREALKENFKIYTLKVLTLQKSKKDETSKYLFKLHDDNAIESVFMKYKYGNTVCVSSQVGCKMGCKFCASTIDGLTRNLTAGEMVSQILDIENSQKQKINHVVVMGTGEPFDNYENLSKFIRILNDKNGINIGMRNITISTCGIIPMVEKFADEFPQVNLAISLHASNSQARSNIMPINEKYDINKLIKACRKYTKKTKRRITFEYTLVLGQNDSTYNIEELIKLLSGMLCHVNLIPLNNVLENELKTVTRKKANQIAEKLIENGIPATVRRELGADIDGACGQLRAKQL